jgi:hypothetical protein
MSRLVPISRILLVHRRFVGGQRAKRRSRRKMSVEASGTCRLRAVRSTQRPRSQVEVKAEGVVQFSDTSGGQMTDGLSDPLYGDGSNLFRSRLRPPW